MAQLSKFSMVLMLLFSVTMNSCSKDEVIGCPDPPTAPTDSSETVIMLFNATANGQPLELLKNFRDPLGRELQVELLKFYVSNIYVHKGLVSKKVGNVGLITLVDPNLPDSVKSINEIALNIPYGNYDQISFSIGLDSVQNAGSPNSFPNSHPLSISQNTYWDSWGKYKFFMIEGKGDWDGDGSLSNIYGYHTGFDACYRTLVFDKQLSIQKDDILESINVDFEVNDVFFGQDTVNMKTNPTWHGEISTIETALIISDNLKDAINLY